MAFQKKGSMELLQNETCEWMKDYLAIFRSSKEIGYPAYIHWFKFNIRNTRKRCEICLKAAIKMPERRQ